MGIKLAISEHQVSVFNYVNYAIFGAITIFWLTGNYLLYEYEQIATLTQSILMIIFAGLAGVMCLILSTKYKISSESGKVWLCISLGMFGWMIGDILYTYFDVFTGEAPFPSIADFFYLIAYLPLTLGFIIQSKIIKVPLNMKEKIVNAIVYITISIIVVVYVLIFPIQSWYEGEAIPIEDLFEITIAVLYPLLDLVLLALVMIVLTKFRHGKINRSWSLLIAGILMTIVGDILFNWVENVIGASILFEMYDLFLLAGYFLIYLGAFFLISLLGRGFETE